MKVTPNCYGTVKYYDIVYRDWISEKLTEKELGLIRSICPVNGSILDVGCGSGRHLIPLAKEGFKIKGIEPIHEFISLTRSKYPQVDITNCTFQKYQSLETFDLIICMWNAFHQIAYSKDEAINALSKMKKLMKSNGKIILNLGVGEDFNVSEYRFEHTVLLNDRKYLLSWTVKDWSPETMTVISIEHISVFNNKNELIDEEEAEIKQRFWTENELKKFAEELDLSLEILAPFKEENSNDGYFIFTKR
jgi:SAM-dependent methyltransferase